MSTVDKKTADDIAAGKYPEDEANRIVEYTNAWGGKAYGVTFGREDGNKYLRPSNYIRSPRVYWDKLRKPVAG